MSLLDQIGSYWKMDKVMLTVFKGKRDGKCNYVEYMSKPPPTLTANKGAFRFYTEKLG